MSKHHYNELKYPASNITCNKIPFYTCILSNTSMVMLRCFKAHWNEGHVINIRKTSQVNLALPQMDCNTVYLLEAWSWLLSNIMRKSWYSRCSFIIIWRWPWVRWWINNWFIHNIFTRFKKKIETYQYRNIFKKNIGIVSWENVLRIHKNKYSFFFKFCN